MRNDVGIAAGRRRCDIFVSLSLSWRGGRAGDGVATDILRVKWQAGTSKVKCHCRDLSRVHGRTSRAEGKSCAERMQKRAAETIIATVNRRSISRDREMIASVRRDRQRARDSRFAIRIRRSMKISRYERVSRVRAHYCAASPSRY